MRANSSAIATTHCGLNGVSSASDTLVALSPLRTLNPRVFPCTRCGACCRNLGESALLSQLDRGDGVCRHLDVDTNLCRIYETRPKICRVTDMYGAFEDRLTWGEYVALNQQACRELQARSYPTEQPS